MPALVMVHGPRGGRIVWGFRTEQLSEEQPMATIVPRWEWRTFGDSFGVADERIDALESTGVVETEETYILAPGSDIVKLRFSLLDIKTLREVNPDGLEQWFPVLKAEFPLSPDDVAAAATALRQPAPTVSAEVATLEDLLAALGSPASGVVATTVKKRRVRYTIGGCTAERSDVEIGGKPARTIAIEDPDPEKVITAVRDIGLGDYLNRSYAAGIPSVLADTPLRVSVIDVGTNSVKLHVAERAADGALHRVIDRAIVSRLGEGLVEGGEIGAEALERTAAAVEELAAEAKAAGAIAIAGVGTAGLRIGTNSTDAVTEIERRGGIRLEVISGEEESRLAYVGATADFAADGSVVVFDTGGGSSQFTFGRGRQVDERYSVNVGAVKYTERFGLAEAVSSDVVAEARTAIAADLSSLDGRPKPETLIGMGGALTNLTAVSLELAAYDPDKVHGTRLERAEVERQIERYRATDADGRRSIAGLQPGRADVILAGACVVLTVMDKLGFDALTVSDRGLRHGVRIERFGS
jgi:exopolyphosphatase/guanosine-5'-triphosphate,3'-diphosphate pyrophosphatase